MKITTKQYTFFLQERFHAGEALVLSPGEAQAFNQLFSENIRNNIDGWVAAAAAELGPDELLSQEVLEELQLRISNYAETYQFQLRTIPARVGPIELAALEISLEKIAQGRRKEGREDPLVDDEEVEQVARSKEVQRQARELVLQRREQARQALVELLGIGQDDDQRGFAE